MLTKYKKYGIGFSEAPYVFFFTKGSCWKYLILLNKSKRNYQKFHAFEKIDGK